MVIDIIMAEGNHQGKSCVNRRQLNSRCTVRFTSHLRQDNVNHHMCHMRMSLIAQTHFKTICNVWVITPHGATSRPSSHASDATLTRPYTTYHPYARGMLSQHSSDAAYHHYAFIVATQHASNSAYHPYACSAPRHAFDAAYHPYAHSAIPTCLQSPLTLAQSSRMLMILTLLQPPQDETMIPLPSPPSPPLNFSAAYHPYALATPSRYASDATLKPPYA
ncbi:hypothetical protein O181_101979 [Austropuccinia psidii MF-1]|uniref:Uncharacterized protein n=1 Tax=Austropuccinia psidii MF-1 TaxID=1389203 RepID=A0A9Q3PHU3_9BASI|nr:hypothetical protein [Austropuccinia psidii MF-1]